MAIDQELLGAVDDRFERTARGLARWPDPHGDRAPAQDECSRLTDPGRWRIAGARAAGALPRVVSAQGWSASGRFGRDEVEAVLADPTGWHDLRGTSWLPVG